MPHERIPTVDECYRLIRKYNMLPNIIEHSRQVMLVSLAMVDKLKDGAVINRDIVIAAALLHDITKTRSLETKEPHDLSGGILLRELGFDKIASIVEEHVVLKNFEPDGPLEEKEIVYYADKRVMHDQVVSSKDRVADLLERYGKTPEIKEMIIKNSGMLMEIEKKIACFISVDIDEAIANMKQ
jgi:uncharacterized protein